MKLTELVYQELSTDEVATLAKARKLLRVRQCDLAQEAGIDVTYLSKIENNKVESLPKALWEKLFLILYMHGLKGDS